MKLKRLIGSLMVMVTSLFINSNSASTLSVGLEEMPESIKKLR